MRRKPGFAAVGAALQGGCGQRRARRAARARAAFASHGAHRRQMAALPRLPAGRRHPRARSRRADAVAFDARGIPAPSSKTSLFGTPLERVASLSALGRTRGVAAGPAAGDFAAFLRLAADLRLDTAWPHHSVPLIQLRRLSRRQNGPLSRAGVFDPRGEESRTSDLRAIAEDVAFSYMRDSAPDPVACDHDAGRRSRRAPIPGPRRRAFGRAGRNRRFSAPGGERRSADPGLAGGVRWRERLRARGGAGDRNGAADPGG